MSAPRVLIVGWDGATWDVLEPLLVQDRLPTLAGLRGRAAWGPPTRDRARLERLCHWHAA